MAGSHLRSGTNNHFRERRSPGKSFASRRSKRHFGNIAGFEVAPRENSTRPITVISNGAEVFEREFGKTERLSLVNALAISSFLE